MVNLTLSIDDEVLKRARIKALEEGTSVNALVREQLVKYAGPTADQQREAVKRILEHAREVAGNAPPATESEGRTWTREDLWDERPRYLSKKSRPS